MTEPKKTALCVLTRFYNSYWIDFLKAFTEYDTYLVIDDYSVLYDKIVEGVHIVQVDDETCQKHNYYKSSSWTNLKDIISWDRALYYFNKVNTSYENVWFMEDDVFIISEKTITNIDRQYPTSDLLTSFHEINPTGDIYQGWNHWVNVIHRIGTPWAHSLVCACRLSRRLLDRVDNYLHDRHLLFIEALFNTLALHHGYLIHNPPEMSTIEYNKPCDYATIHERNIYHPIKKIEDHIAIRAAVASYNNNTP